MISRQLTVDSSGQVHAMQSITLNTHKTVVSISMASNPDTTQSGICMLSSIQAAAALIKAQL